MDARIVPANLTVLLSAWSAGDSSALDELMGSLRDHLHRIAQRKIRSERAGHTLQPTALVHEAYLRLIDKKEPGSFKDRAHFLALCAQIMRQILVDYARRHGAAKRGEGSRVQLDEAYAFVPERSDDLLSLDEALHRLADLHVRKGKVVELRFFGGLSNAEVAAVLGVSENTVLRDWLFARAWLQQELSA